MEISFESKTVGIYKEISHQIKRSQESTESVVPDTNDDIGRIASVQTYVMLKSKDLSARGVTVSGEAGATILYITESGGGVSFVRLTRAFTMDFEVNGIDADAVAQISLSVTNSEARAVNPRKVSVTFELTGELSCYRREELIVQSVPPESGSLGIYSNLESAETVVTTAVCEKTFALNEQFAFPGGKPAPCQIVNQCSEIELTDTQLIGSKAIIKGNVNISACYLSNEVNYPVKIDFSTPFSQILDTGDENIESCSACIEMISAYCDLIDTISGEKALDIEIHALTQLTARRRQSVSYISDAYSNIMPLQCVIQTSQYSMFGEVQRVKLSCDERVSIMDDCSDVLSVFTGVSQLTLQQGRVSAVVTLDVVYRTGSGSLSAARRTVSLEGDCPGQSARVLGSRLCDMYLRPDGAYVDAHMALELSYYSCSSVELRRVGAVVLNEEAAYDQSRFASLSLVRAEGESLWMLAKQYHSSIDCIARYNDISEGVAGKMLLIPRRG